MDPIQGVLEAHMHTDPIAKAAFDVLQGDVPGRAAIAKILDFLFMDRARLTAEAAKAALNQQPPPVNLTCQECSGHWWVTRENDAL